MKRISAPYSIMNTEIDYHTHSQYNSYINSLGQGISKASQKHADRIAKSNIQAAKHIQNGLNDISYQQARVHEALIDQTNVVQSGLNSIEVNLERGFDGVNQNLHRVNQGLNQINENIIVTEQTLRNGLTALKSSFDMGMMNIVSQFELQRAEITRGFNQLVDVLKNSRKTEANERYNDGKNEFEKYLQFPEEIQFLTDALEYLKKSIEIYKGNPFCHLYLGHIYKTPTQYYNLELSLKHYKLCATYAKGTQNKELAALGYFLAGWIAYVSKDLDNAIQLAELSLKFDDQGIPENYYNLAKYYACKKNTEKSLLNLDYIVKKFDPLYIIKANIDEDFTKNIKEELESYFSEIRNTEAKKLEKKLNNFGLNI